MTPGGHVPARDRTGLGILVVLLLVSWAGFIFHRSPRFPGSLTGGVLAVSGATLMVAFSLAYVAVKRIPGLKERITPRVSMRQVVTWHVYTSALGAILAMLHTGHRFESNLGIALTTMMLLTTLSGYVGAHLLGRVSLELREKQDLLSRLSTAYNEAVRELSSVTDPVIIAAASRDLLSRLRTFAMPRSVREKGSGNLPLRAVRMAESIAELEYSIESHERIKRAASVWLKLHIATALAFYALLALHVWAAIHFGLRWFE